MNWMGSVHASGTHNQIIQCNNMREGLVLGMLFQLLNNYHNNTIYVATNENCLLLIDIAHAYALAELSLWIGIIMYEQVHCKQPNLTHYHVLSCPGYFENFWGYFKGFQCLQCTESFIIAGSVGWSWCITIQIHSLYKSVVYIIIQRSRSQLTCAFSIIYNYDVKVQAWQINISCC